MHIADSLCCTVETNATLKSNYSPIKKLFKKKLQCLYILSSSYPETICSPFLYFSSWHLIVIFTLLTFTSLLSVCLYLVALPCTPTFLISAPLKCYLGSLPDFPRVEYQYTFCCDSSKALAWLPCSWSPSTRTSFHLHLHPWAPGGKRLYSVHP